MTFAVTEKFWFQFNKGMDKVPVVFISEETNNFNSSVGLFCLKFSMNPNQKSFPFVGMAWFCAREKEETNSQSTPIRTMWIERYLKGGRSRFFDKAEVFCGGKWENLYDSFSKLANTVAN